MYHSYTKEVLFYQNLHLIAIWKSCIQRCVGSVDISSKLETSIFRVYRTSLGCHNFTFKIHFQTYMSPLTFRPHSLKSPKEIYKYYKYFKDSLIAENKITDDDELTKGALKLLNDFLFKSVSALTSLEFQLGEVWDFRAVFKVSKFRRWIFDV